MTNDADRLPRRITLRGEVDLDRVPALKVAVDAALMGHPTTLGLDLAEVTFLDCAGLGGLMWSLRRAQAAGARLVLIAASPAVLRMLTVTDSRRCFALVPEPWAA